MDVAKILEELKKERQGHWYLWYLCATCQACGQPIQILAALLNAPIQSDGTFSFRDVPCPHCGEKHDYPLDALQRRQAQ